MTLDGKQRELIKRLMAERGVGKAGGAGGIPSRGGTDGAPLSSAQQRMWFHHRLHPTSAAYHLTVAARLSGELVEQALLDAFADVVRRHEILRTNYRTDEHGQPVQVVRPPGAVTVTRRSLDGTDPADVDEAVARLAGEFGAEPMDIAVEPPVKLMLVHAGRQDCSLVLVVHHIACDDLTWEVLLGEIADGYRARLAGTEPDLTPPRIQYGDYAAWEQGTAATTDAGMDWWQSVLSPPPQPLPLVAGARAPIPSDEGGRVACQVPAEVAHRMRAIGQETGCTPFMVLLAAFYAVLSRYTGSTDVVVGAPVVNRDRPELRRLVGNFGNTVVLRADLGGDPTFRELLDRVRLVCTGAYAHQDTPVDKLVNHLRLERDSGRNPLFDLVFSMRSGVFGGLTLPGLSVREIPVHNGTARFDLAVQAVQEDDGYSLAATYRHELFTGEFVAGLLGHMVTLLGCAVADPDRHLCDLDLLTPAELDLLGEWNDTDEPALRADATLVELVERQVAATPLAPAVAFEDELVTYIELNARANRLASHLVSIGVGREDLVGIHLLRGTELVVALLAVLKAGGAFVPLEPDWPAARILGIADGAELTAVISRSDGAPDDAVEFTVPVVDLTADRAAIDAHPDHDLPPRTTTEHLAYVIYTSGTTGKPKGAMIRHRAICNRLPWQKRLLGFGPGDAVLHKAPLGFDISINEIFLPLTSGALLVVAGPGADRDIGALAELMARHRVTFVYLVSSMLEAMLDRADLQEAAESLRYVWCGGEVLTPELFERYRQRLGHTTMYHGYGPAETTIGVTCEPYAVGTSRHNTTIGRPNPNTRVHVLDEHLNPMPIGMPGELYVGGTPLARGYLSDPRMTADRFVPDPFAREPGHRLYRTGDLARVLGDGTVEYLGREDNQVKIRGHRVELEEIEAVLGEHPGVRQAAVLVRTERPGVSTLTAYCVATDPADRPEDELVRHWLRTRVPDYMVPAELTFLANLPLTSSGKVDRKALAKIPPSRKPTGRHIAPDEGLEQRIAGIWRDVLAVDQVGAHDNFFDLGGQSLLLLKVQSALERDLARRIPVVDLYTHTTVRALATHLGTREAPPDRPDRGDRVLRARAAARLSASRGRARARDDD